MDPDGTGLTELTLGLSGGHHPVWSPKGGRVIAFSDNRFGSDDIFVMNEYGTGVTRLTTSAAAEHSPAWSPDGRKIAFVSDADGDDEVVVMNADGSNLVNLTSVQARMIVSPPGRRRMTGRQLVFSNFHSGLHAEIFRMNADGTAVTQLTFFDAQTYTPDWKR